MAVYLIAWIMSVVASCAASIGIATGHQTIGAIVSASAALIALGCGIYVLRKGE
jgi:hypothetical protein